MSGKLASLLIAECILTQLLVHGNSPPVLSGIDSVSGKQGESIPIIQTVGQVSTLAGGAGANDGFGYEDGPGHHALFNLPQGIVADSAGNLFIADSQNNRIRTIVPDGVVSTFVGDGSLTLKEGVGTQANIPLPELMTISSNDEIYVTHLSFLSGYAILKITPSGQVSKVIESKVPFTSEDGAESDANLGTISGLSYDSERNVIYFSDSSRHTIRKIDLNLPKTDANYVSTLAGAGTLGFAEGTGTAAKFSFPFDIKLDSSGNLFVADFFNHRIRKVTPEGVVQTVAGDGEPDPSENFAESQSLSSPRTFEILNDRYLYVPTNNFLKKIDIQTNEVTSLFGKNFPVSIDGSFRQATLGDQVLRMASYGGSLYFLSRGPDLFTSDAHKVRQIDLTGPIEVTDKDGGLLTVNLSATKGALSVTLSGGVSISSGSNHSEALSLQGEQEELNASLATLIFEPEIGYSGQASLRYAASDGVHTSTELTSTIEVLPNSFINTHPSITQLDPITGVSDSQIPISQAEDPVQTLTVHDEDSYTLTVSFTATHGTLSVELAGLTSVASGSNHSSNFSLYGTQRNLNDTLATLTFQSEGGFTGEATVTYSVSDDTDSSDEFAIAVTVEAGEVIANNPPVMTGVDSITGVKNTQIPVLIEEGFVRSFAGGGRMGTGFKNGSAEEAMFSDPIGIVADAEGNLFVADHFRIRKITPSGDVSTFAGNGSGGIKEGRGLKAGVGSPQYLTITDSGDIYTSVYTEFSLYEILKISPSGDVTRVVDSRKIEEAVEGGSGFANLSGVPSVAFDSARNLLYFTDRFSHAIYRVDLNHTSVEENHIGILAGSITSGYEDGVGASARFKHPSGISLDRLGNLYIADTANLRICKVTPDGVVTTIARTDDPESTIIGMPNHLTMVDDRFLYVPTKEGLKRVDLHRNNQVTTLFGRHNFDLINGDFSTATLGLSIAGITSYGNKLYMTEWGLDRSIFRKAHKVREVTLPDPFQISNEVEETLTIRFNVTNGTLSVIPAGSASIASGSNLSPSLSIEGSAEDLNDTLASLQFHPDTDFTGQASLSYSAGNGRHSTELFQTSIMVVDQLNTPPSLNISISISGEQNASIPIKSEGTVRSYVGGKGIGEGYAEGPADQALFKDIGGIVADDAGNFFVADTLNHRIRKVDTHGNVSTFAGNGVAAIQEGVGTEASIKYPQYITISSSGDLYVLASSYIGKNSIFLKITSDGEVFILIESVGDLETINGAAGVASFDSIGGIAFDSSRNWLYFSDYSNHQIRKVDLSRISSDSTFVTTVAGTGGAGYVDGNGLAAKFNFPGDVDIDSQGNLYVADRDNNRIRKISPEGHVSTIAGNGTNLDYEDPQTIPAPHHLAVVDDNFIYATAGGLLKKVDLLNENETSTVFGFEELGFYDGEFDNATVGVDVMGITAHGNHLFLANAGHDDLLSGGETSKIRKITFPGTVSVTDEDDDTITTHFAVTDGILSVTLSGGVNVVSGANDSASMALSGSEHDLNSTLASLTFHPEQGFTGEATLTSSVSDGIVTTRERKTKILIQEEENQPPVLTPIGTQTIQENESLTITLAATDPDGDSLTFSAMGSDHISASISGLELMLTPNQGWQGSEEITVMVEDGKGGSDSKRFLVTVTPEDDSLTNSPPQVTKLTDFSSDPAEAIPVVDEGWVSVFVGNESEDGAPVHIDGPKETATFGVTMDLTSDAMGNLYVTDTPTVRKISPDGEVTTLAGNPDGTGDFKEGIGKGAELPGVWEIASSPTGEVFVSGGSYFARISPTGEVTRITHNYSNPTTIGSASSMVFDPDRNSLYFTTGPKIQKIDFNLNNDDQEFVTTLAGDSHGFEDGPGTIAKFGSPLGLTIDSAGNLYVADDGRIRRITPDGDVATIAGSGTYGNLDGVGGEAAFSHSIWAMTVSEDDVLYLLDLSAVRSIDLETKRVKTLLEGPVMGSIKGSGNGGFHEAGLYQPNHGIAYHNNNLFIAQDDSSLKHIRRVDLPGPIQVSDRDGDELSISLTADSGGLSLSLYGDARITHGENQSSSITVEANSDDLNRSLETLTFHPVNGFSGDATMAYTVTDGTHTTEEYRTIISIRPAPNSPPTLEPIGDLSFERAESSQFSISVSATDPDGDDLFYNLKYRSPIGGGVQGDKLNIFADLSFLGTGELTVEVEDGKGGMDSETFLVTIHPENVPPSIGIVQDIITEYQPSISLKSDGYVETLAGGNGTGFQNGPAEDAKFSLPIAIVVDDKSNLYVTGNNRIRVLSPDGVVSTFAGDGTNGLNEGIGELASIKNPHGLTITESSDFYSYGYLGPRSVYIMKVSKDGEVSIVLESNSKESIDGSALHGQLGNLRDIAYDPSRNYLYFTELISNSIRYLDLNAPPIDEGFISTLAGSGDAGFADGKGASAEFNDIKSMVLDQAGNLYVADVDNHRIRRVTPNGTVTTIAGGVSPDVEGVDISQAIFFPQTIAISEDNRFLYVQTSEQLKQIDLHDNNVVSVIAGKYREFSHEMHELKDGDLETAIFGNWVNDMTYKNGSLYFIDRGRRKVSETTTKSIYPIRRVNLPSLNVSDPDSDVVRVNFYVSEGDLSLNLSGDTVVRNGEIGNQQFVIEGSVEDINDSLASLTFQPPIDFTGEVTFTYQISDLENPTIYNSSTITIIEAEDEAQNESPNLSAIDNLTTTENTSKTINLSATDTDGDTLTYSSAVESGNVTTEVAGNSLTLTPETDWIGTAVISVSVDDGNGGSDTKTFEITVLPPSGSSKLEISQIPKIYGIQDTMIPIDTEGWVSTIAGGGMQGTGYADGPSSESLFNWMADIQSIVADSKGNLFIPDDGNHRIRKVTPDGETITFAGDGVDHIVEGTGTEAGVWLPSVLAIDENDMLYLASGNANRGYVILKITPEAKVTILFEALKPTSDYPTTVADGPAGTATLGDISGMVVDSERNLLYFTNHHSIRKIDLNLPTIDEGFVSTLVGTGELGFADGIGLEARFYNPKGLDLDSEGNLYVAEQGNHSIRKVTPEGVVSTIAGDGTFPDTQDLKESSGFYYPARLALVDDHTIVVPTDGLLKQIDLSQNNTVTTVFGERGSGAPLNGDFETAILAGPVPIISINGDLYTAEMGDIKAPMTPPDEFQFYPANAIRKIDMPKPLEIKGPTAGNLTVHLTVTKGTLSANLSGAATIASGENHSATISIEGTEEDLNATLATLHFQPEAGYIGEALLTYSIRDSQHTSEELQTRITIEKKNSPGNAHPILVYVGPLSFNEDETLTFPLMASDTDEDPLSFSVTGPEHFEISVSDATAVEGFPAFVKGAELSITPSPDWHGTESIRLLVEDGRGGQDSETILVTVHPVDDLTPNSPPHVTKLTDFSSDPLEAIPVVDQGWVSVYVDKDAGFLFPFDLASDQAGNLYLHDYDEHPAVRKITPDGTVTTLAGGTFEYPGEFKEGTGTEAKLPGMWVMASSPSGEIFVSGNYSLDRQNKDYIARISPDGDVTAILHQDDSTPVDGNADSARIGDVQEMVFDPVRNFLYFTTINSVRKIDFNLAPSDSGLVSTLAGGVSGRADGFGLNAQFEHPLGIAIDSSGNLYVSDDGRIRKVTPEGQVTTIAGRDVYGTQDGIGSDATFSNSIWAMTVSQDDILYVVDGSAVRAIDLQTHEVRTLLGDWYMSSSANGGFHEAKLYNPVHGITAVNDTLFISQGEEDPQHIRKVDLPGPIKLRDSDGDPLTIALASSVGTLSVSLAGSTVISSGSNQSANLTLEGFEEELNATLASLQFHPETGFSGEAILTYSVSDGTHNTDECTTTITVREHPNSLPILTPIGAQTFEKVAGESIEIQLSASDADGDDLFYKVQSSGPISGYIEETTLQVLSEYNWFGTGELTVSVTDGKGSTDTETFNVTIIEEGGDTPANRNPILAHIPNQSMPENMVKTLTLNASDADEDALTLTAAVNSENVTADITGNTLTLTPATDWVGTTSIKITVNDGNGGSVSQTFLLAVNEVNVAPVLSSIGNQTTEEDVSKSLTLSASDPDGDELEYFATVTSSGVVAKVTGTTLELVPNANWNGQASIRVTVSDGNGGTDSQIFDLTVTPVQDVPILSAIGDQTGSEDVPKSIVLSATDGDNDDLTYVDVVNSGQVSATLSPKTLTLTPDVNWHGLANITLTVNDGQGGMDSETFDLTVESINDDPLLSDINNQTTKEGESLSIPLSGTDVDGDALMYAAIVHSGNVTTTATGNTLELVPAANWHGVANITATVNDGNGGTASDSFSLTVTSSNEAPVLAAISAQTTTEDKAIILLLSATDSDNDPLSYSATVNSGDVVTFIKDESLILLPERNWVGTANITVTVKDGEGESHSQTFDLTVTARNDAPDLAEIIDVVTHKDIAKSFPLSAIDVDGDTLTFSAVVNSGNVTANITNSTLELTPEPNWVGIAHLTITVEDGNGGEDSESFNLIVSPSSPIKINQLSPISGEANQPVLVQTKAQVRTVAEAANGLFGDLEETVISPTGVVADSLGNLFLTDFYTNRIRKITPDGQISTFAGNGQMEFVAGVGAHASIPRPQYIAINSQDELFVTANPGSKSCIVKISPHGEVSSLIESPSTFDIEDGAAGTATLGTITGLAVDSFRNLLYFSNAIHHKVRVIDLNISPEDFGFVRTYAGTGLEGYFDGPGQDARFNLPFDLEIDPFGNLYVADSGNLRVRKINPSGIVSTFAGDGGPVSPNEFRNSPSLATPRNLALVEGDALYVPTWGHMKKVDFKDGNPVSTLFGSIPRQEIIDGGFDVATLGHKVLDITAAGQDLFFTSRGTKANSNTMTYAVRKVEQPNSIRILSADSDWLTLHLSVTHGVLSVTLAGSASILAGENNTATLTVEGSATDINSTLSELYFTPENNFVGEATLTYSASDEAYTTPDVHTPIRIPEYVEPINRVPVLGTIGVQAINEDEYRMILLSASDPDGDPLRFHAQSSDHISATLISPGPYLSIVPQPNWDGFEEIIVTVEDGKGGSDSETVIVLVNPRNDTPTIRNLGPVIGMAGQAIPIQNPGWVSNFAGGGSIGVGFADGLTHEALFNEPHDIVEDSAGNLFIADQANHRIRKITPEGVVSTFAGNGEDTLKEGLGTDAQIPRPTRMAINAADELFVTSSDLSIGQALLKISPAGEVVTILQAQGQASVNGNAADADMGKIAGIAVDSQRNVLYLSDSSHHVIRSIQLNLLPDDPEFVGTLAGSPGTKGHVDEVGSAAHFYIPTDLLLDEAGNLLVADSGNHVIRKITPTGEVSTIAGTNGYIPASLFPESAYFNTPGYLAELDGNLFVPNWGHLKKVDLANNNEVSTLFGNFTPEAINGDFRTANIGYILGVTSSNGNLYFTDHADDANSYQQAHRIRKVEFQAPIQVEDVDSHLLTIHFSTSNGTLSVTLAGAARILYGQNHSSSLSLEGTAKDLNATLRNLLFTPQNGFLGKATLTYMVSDGIASSEYMTTNIMVTEDGERINNDPFLYSIGAQTLEEDASIDIDLSAHDADGDELSFSVTRSDHILVKLSENTLTVTPAPNWQGVEEITVTVKDNYGGSDSETFTVTVLASNDPPSIISIDFITGTENTALPIHNPGWVSTIAGGARGYVEGLGTHALFNSPSGIAADSVGNLLIADHYNHRIRKIVDETLVSTLAGYGGLGLNDGTGTDAGIRRPEKVAIDSNDNLYVMHYGNGGQNIRKITPEGVVSTVFISPTFRSKDGDSSTAHLGAIHGMVVDTENDLLYFTDSVAHSIRKIDLATGFVSTVAGGRGPGFADGNGDEALFYFPKGIQMDSAGNLYVADLLNYRIRKVTPEGEVSTVTGSSAIDLGWYTIARLNEPRRLALMDDNTLFVTTKRNLWKVDLANDGKVTRVIGGDYHHNPDGAFDVATMGFIPHITTFENKIYFTQQTYNANSVRKIEFGGKIEVWDTDSETLSVTFAVTHGTLSFNLAGAATVTSGSNDSAAFTLEGSQEDLNATLTSLHFLPETDFQGEATMTYSASDGINTLPDSITRIVIEEKENTPPELQPIGPQVTEEDTELILVVDASDPDGDSLELVATGSPHISTTLTGTSLKLQPQPNWFGTETLSILVVDEFGGTTSESFEVTVTSVNDTPILAALEDQSTEEDVAKLIAISATDADGDPLSYSVTVNSGNVTAHLIGDFIEVFPAPNWSGVAEITFSVEDGNGGVQEESFHLTVTPVNDLPILAPIANQETPENINKTLTLAASDIEGQALTYSATVDSGNVTAEVSGTTLELIPHLDWYGQAHITATVVDEQGGSASRTFTLTVNDVNAPPVLAPIGNQTTSENVTKTLELSAQDPDGDTLTLTATVTPEQVRALIVDSTLILIPDPNWNGVAKISVSVTDNKGGLDIETFDLNVSSVNEFPSLAFIDHQSTTEGVTQTLELSATDPDNDPLTFNVEVSSDKVRALLADSTLILIPEFNWTGSSSITVTVEDGLGGRDSQTFLFTVVADNDENPNDDTPQEPEIIPDGTGESPPNLTFDTTNDSDGDGLSDGLEENIFGTDPNNPDTDDNGINDGDQVGDDRNPPNSGPDNSQGMFTPIVTTLSVEEGYRLLGQIDWNGGGEIISAGFRVSPSPAFPESYTTVYTATPDQSGHFSLEVMHFASLATNHVQAFAINSKGISYGFAKEFTPTPPIPSIWYNAIPIGDTGWYDTQIGLIFIQAGSQWIYHADWGWLYVVGETLNDVWFWNETNGWHWTSLEVYPYLYRQNAGGWVYWIMNGNQYPEAFNTVTGFFEDGI